MMTDRPNIILIVLDTVRAEQLGLYGRDIDPMPNLTTFAQNENSVVYDRAYTNAPWTLPAHASLFTGEVPSEHRCHGASPEFNPGTKPLAVQLSDAGYDTYGISNNIWISDHFGFEEGFDTFYKQWQLFRESSDIGHVLKKGYESKRELVSEMLRGNPLVNLFNGLYGKYLYRRNDFGAARTTDDALSLVDRSESPFFLFANYMEAHAPYQVHKCSEKYLPENVTDPTKFTELSSRSLDFHTGRLNISSEDFDAIEGLYDGELRYLDNQLAGFLNGLDQRGLLEESVVVILGDHGENIGDHGLMAHRFSMNETLLHVPLVIRFPSKSSANLSRSDAPLSLVDVFDFLLRTGTKGEVSELSQRGLVISQYLSTSYTPESRDDEFDFKASEFNRRYNTIINDRYKIVIDDSGDRKIYEFDGQELNRIDDPPDTTELEDYVDFLSNQQQESSNISNEVSRQLDDLGYI